MARITGLGSSNYSSFHFVSTHISIVFLQICCIAHSSQQPQRELFSAARVRRSNDVNSIVPQCHLKSYSPEQVVANPTGRFNYALAFSSSVRKYCPGTGFDTFISCTCSWPVGLTVLFDMSFLI